MVEQPRQNRSFEGPVAKAMGEFLELEDEGLNRAALNDFVRRHRKESAGFLEEVAAQLRVLNAPPEIVSQLLSGEASDDS